MMKKKNHNHLKYQDELLATQNDCKILTAVKVSSTEDKWCALRIQGLQPLNKPMRAWILKRCGLKKFHSFYMSLCVKKKDAAPLSI